MISASSHMAACHAWHRRVNGMLHLCPWSLIYCSGPNHFLRIQSPFLAKSPFFDWSHPNSFEHPPVITPGSDLWLIFPWQPTFVDGFPTIFPRFSYGFPYISCRDFPIFSQVPGQSSIAFISGAGVLQRSMRGNTFDWSFHFRWWGIQYTCIYYIHIQYIISFSDCASILPSMWWCLLETNLEYPASIYICVCELWQYK